MDRSMILTFCPGSGAAWCNSNMVLWTIDWNAKLHRFGSSYIRACGASGSLPWKLTETNNKGRTNTYQKIMTPYVLPLVHRFLGHEHVRAVGELFKKRSLSTAHIALDEHRVRPYVRAAGTAVSVILVYGIGG